MTTFPTLFDGITFKPKLDGARLNRQLQAVYELMKDGEWYSPEQIEKATGIGWASASARCRDFRKEKFGGHVVDRRRVSGGLYEYRLIVNQQEGAR